MVGFPSRIPSEILKKSSQWSEFSHDLPQPFPPTEAATFFFGSIFRMTAASHSPHWCTMRHWDAGQWENGGEIEPQQWQFEWGMMNHHLFEHLPAVFLHVKTELGMIHHQLFEFQRNPDGVCLLKWRVRESTRGAGRSNPTEVAPSKRLCTLCRCPLWISTTLDLGMGQKWRPCGPQILVDF